MKKLLLALTVFAAFLSAPSRAEIKRSAAAKSDFKYSHPCPGYVIDHIKALACGGDDAPSNMQWQSVEQSKAKDAWEHKGCATRATKHYKKRFY